MSPPAWGEDDKAKRFTFAVLESDLLVAAPFPHPFAKTVAVHVLTDRVHDSKLGFVLYFFLHFVPFFIS